MKTSKLHSTILKLILVITIGQFFTSCASLKIEKRKYRKGFNVELFSKVGSIKQVKRQSSNLNGEVDYSKDEVIVNCDSDSLEEKLVEVVQSEENEQVEKDLLVAKSVVTKKIKKAPVQTEDDSPKVEKSHKSYSNLLSSIGKRTVGVVAKKVKKMSSSTSNTSNKKNAKKVNRVLDIVGRIFLAILFFLLVVAVFGGFMYLLFWAMFTIESIKAIMIIAAGIGLIMRLAWEFVVLPIFEKIIFG